MELREILDARAGVGATAICGQPLKFVLGLQQCRDFNSVEAVAEL